jgi:hypothetical protein
MNDLAKLIFLIVGVLVGGVVGHFIGWVVGLLVGSLMQSYGLASVDVTCGLLGTLIFSACLSARSLGATTLCLTHAGS